MANFFIKKNDSFVVTVPFDVTDPENPRIILIDRIENCRNILLEVEESCLEYHWMRFRRPDWGLDCYMRELSYVTVQPTGGADRILSQERLDEIRLRYLLLGSSFFSDSTIGFVNINGREALNDASESFVKSLDPVIPRVFLSIASQILDLGVPVKRLLNKEDFTEIRKNPDFIKKLLVAKGLLPKSALVDEESDVTKKKSESGPSEPSIAQSNPETPAGQP